MEIITTSKGKCDRIILHMESASLIKRYKIPFLISLVVALAVITLGYENSPIGAVLTFLASIAGLFFVDLGTILHAYIVDPLTDQSQILIKSIKEKRFKDLIEFFNNGEYGVADPTIKSVLFQGLLMVFVYYANLGGIPGFAKALILSFAGTLIYSQMLELQITHSLKRWFWMYKGEVSYKLYTWYLVTVVIIYVYSFTLI